MQSDERLSVPIGKHYTVFSEFWITGKQKYYKLYGDTRQSEAN